MENPAKLVFFAHTKFCFLPLLMFIISFPFFFFLNIHKSDAKTIKTAPLIYSMIW